MTEVIAKTRRIFVMETIVYEDGNVETRTTVHDKPNALGRKSHVLSEEEQRALLWIIKDKLEETFPEPQRIERAVEQPMIEETANWPRLES